MHITYNFVATVGLYAEVGKLYFISFVDKGKPHLSINITWINFIRSRPFFYAAATLPFNDRNFKLERDCHNRKFNLPILCLTLMSLSVAMREPTKTNASALGSSITKN